MKNKSRIIWFILVALFFLTAAWLVWQFSHNEQNQNIISSNARLEITRVDVSTLYPDRVTSINVKEGDTVTKDSLLV